MLNKIRTAQVLVFIFSGLLTAFPGEFVNNFLVMDNAGNFAFAMMFYTVSLVLFYGFAKKLSSRLTALSLCVYMIVAGVGWGLILNEWILVGNHPLNPDTHSLLSQLSMLAYHTLVYTVPLAVVFMPRVREWLFTCVRIILPAFLGILVIGFFIKLKGLAEAVLAWTIITTYFLGYLPFGGLFVYRMFKGVHAHI